jgi:hypothetical protein
MKKVWHEFELFTINPDLKDLGINQESTKRPVSILLNEVTDFYESYNHENEIPGTHVGLRSGENYFLIIEYKEFKNLMKFAHDHYKV